MNSATNHQRREVYFSGRVQGVGFRYTVQQLSRRFPVTGFVRNLSNGQVHLVAEGDRTAVDAFLTEIESEMAGYIADRLVDKPPATGEFNSFGIRH